MSEQYRPRLSIVLDQKDFDNLNEVIGPLKIKNALFNAITKDLIRIMKEMTPQQRSILIVGIIDQKLGIEEWSKTIKGAKNE